MIRFVLSVISVNLYNDQTRCFVDRMRKYFSSLLMGVGFSVAARPTPWWGRRPEQLLQELRVHPVFRRPG